MQASALHPRSRAGSRSPRRGQAAQQPRAALPEPGTVPTFSNNNAKIDDFTGGRVDDPLE